MSLGKTGEEWGERSEERGGCPARSSGGRSSSSSRSFFLAAHLARPCLTTPFGCPRSGLTATGQIVSGWDKTLRSVGVPPQLPFTSE